MVRAAATFHRRAAKKSRNVAHDRCVVLLMFLQELRVLEGCVLKLSREDDGSICGDRHAIDQNRGAVILVDTGFWRGSKTKETVCVCWRLLSH